MPIIIIMNTPDRRMIKVKDIDIPLCGYQEKNTQDGFNAYLYDFTIYLISLYFPEGSEPQLSPDPF